jgi:site-specific DNA-methyltransferase (adenine-specific)
MAVQTLRAEAGGGDRAGGGVSEPVIIGNAKLYLGDCLDILPGLPKVDAVITDPPYGIGYSHNGNDRSGIGKGRWATKFNDIAIHGDDEPFDPGHLLGFDAVILFGGNHFASKLPDSKSWLVWDKRATSKHTNDFSDCEMAWTNLGKVARMFRHQWDGMMKASEQGISRSHPTQKPVALMRWCIEQAGHPQTILDPYMGSGTTGVACMQMGRAFIGIEKEPKYFDIACKRIEQAQKQPDMFIEPKPIAMPEQLSMAEAFE